MSLHSPPPSIRAALAALKAKQCIIIVDDKHRENEGDLVLAAEYATPEALAFMIRYTGGVVCLALSPTLATRLQLSTITPRHVSSPTQPHFIDSIEARHGVTTGISAADRATTIRTAMDPASTPEDLVSPGHVLTLRAHDGGVLVRAGHTEASVDLCRLAGMQEGAVISELMHDDGTMMRMPAIKLFAKKHRIPILTIADLISYRRKITSHISRQASSDLQTAYGTFSITVYTDSQGREHVGMSMGKIRSQEAVLVRMHSECLTGDVFHSRHCDCGAQLTLAMRTIAREKKGVIVYLRQEGRGIGLANKIRAYGLQHAGLDTVDANRALGLPDDLREYGIGAQILRDLGVRKIRLLTNNPKKVAGLRGYGLSITETVPLEISPKSALQRRYLQTKKHRMGHRLRRV